MREEGNDYTWTTVVISTTGHSAWADSAVNLPSGQVLLALVPVLALVLGVVVFALVDLIRRPVVAYLPKPVWAVIIAVVALPFGAIAYLVAGRRPTGAHPAPAGEPAPRVDGGAHPGSPPPPSTTVAAPAAVATPRTDRPTAVDPSVLVQTLALTRDYGGKGLFDVDLVVPRGCIYGLVGPNGSGKTTLLSILDGTRRADRGTVRVALPRKRIAVCPDVPEFDGWLTASEVVGLAAAMIDPDRSPRAAIDALNLAGLGDDVDRRVAGFSRGMLQRLGLACALVGDPELLILDEPTSALDPAGRADVLDLVLSMRGRRTVIFSSHILADVQRVADQVGVLRRGRLLYQGSTQQLIDDRLQPRWLVRVAGDASAFRARLSAQPWVTRIVPVGPDAVRIEAATIEDGERGIPRVLASGADRLVSCEPVAADLEAAFLALTNV